MRSAGATRIASALCALAVLAASLGYLMNRARDWGQTDVIVVGILIYAVLGLLSDLVVRAIEARVLRYRRTA